MWRDRTNLFISYRQSYAHHPSKKPRFGPSSSNGFSADPQPSDGFSDERRGLMSAGAYEDDGDVVIEMDLLPPRWLDVQDEVNEALAQITVETRKLEQLHSKHILPGFEDEDVKKREEWEIERLTQLITKKFQQCQRAIKRIDALVSEARAHGGVQKGEETMATNLKISLATKVGDISTAFRKKQSTYLRKLRTMGGLSSPVPGTSSPVRNSYTDPSLMDSEADRSFSQSTLQQTQQQRMLLHDNDTVIAQREREIEDIAQGIIELANIFQELNTMVIDQGSMLDRIDYNVERMATDMKEADRELTVATGYQRRSIKRKIMLLLIIVIFGVFILLGIKFGRSSSSPAPAPAPAIPEPDSGPPTLSKMMKRSSYSKAIEPPFLLKRDWRRRRRRWEVLESI
ncbi:t-SNARE affecting a late Golgi compartment protein 2 [Microthyrium microscopicum]|uniref:t-SNARE affecting a late Golgi compartment protein 2 n=1 Tax=Microthyrium microscopicum TaxID=703497 RepID=A0A6A6UVD9_9PEZI|nr:t-SNARE affecting a late Golgi compartment protein 2 [Microthyrium microscopicum]